MTYPAGDLAVTRRAWARAAAMLVALVVAGCAPAGGRPYFAEDDEGALAPSDGQICLPPGGDLSGFAASEVVVVAPRAVTQRCVLLADTPELRSRGLMGVSDLGGYHGMLFAFPQETGGGFWMRDTLIPLTVAFVDSGGSVVSVLDMEPCPAGGDCPSYQPGVTYRWALEVPQGMIEAFGLVEGASLDAARLPHAHE